MTLQAADPTVLNQTPRVRIVRALRELMHSGKLPAGERVPTVGVLAARLLVARATVHAALLELEQAGELQRRGRSRYVPAAGAPPTASRALSDTVAVLLPANLPTGWDPLQPGWDARASGWSIAVSIGAAQELQDCGFHALTLQPAKLNGERLRQLAASGLRGVVIPGDDLTTGVSPALLAELAQARLPVVLHAATQPWTRHDTVASDHAQGAYELTRALLARGCRRLLCFWALAPGTPPDCAWLQQREAGVRRALREAGLPLLPVVQPPALAQPRGDLLAHEQTVRLYAGYLLEACRDPAHRPDAILLSSDGAGYAATAACRLLGLEPGRDLLLAGYDGYWASCPERAFADFCPVVTVDKRNLELGRELTRLLLARLAGTLPAPPQHRLVCPALVVPPPPMVTRLPPSRPARRRA